MQVPDTKVAEIVDGELIVSPRPASPHAHAATLLGGEVISPATGRIDRSRKMHIYAREGVDGLWFVDPLARTLEIYRLDVGRWIVASTHGGDDVVRAEPFAAVELALERWWLPGAA